MLSSVDDIFLSEWKKSDTITRTAFVSNDTNVSYGELLQAIDDWTEKFRNDGVASGDVVLLKGDFSLSAISALFALFQHRAITVLVAPSSYEKELEFCEASKAQWILDTESNTLSKTNFDGKFDLFGELRSINAAGLVFFSSGSTGTPKGAVHNVENLISKFSKPGKNLRTLAFLLFDHIAGIDTLLYSLANASTLVLPSSRAPKDVCALIEKHKVEVFPTAPSFLNLLLLSKAYETHDLSSLKIITYGSEMMPHSTLEQVSKIFSNARIIQKYGTSEIGALPSKSRSSNSTWIKLGGDGYDWRVRDGLFEIKANTAMVGYLNAPTPFTEDGYFKTGDQVEQDGEYIRFLGRDSDIINVGGQKVFPAEVEACIREMDEIAEVSVYGQKHPILGAAVVAKIRPAKEDATPAEVRNAIRQHLSGNLEPYKIPQKYIMTRDALTTERFKQIRKDV